MNLTRLERLESDVKRQNGGDKTNSGKTVITLSSTLVIVFLCTWLVCCYSALEGGRASAGQQQVPPEELRSTKEEPHAQTND
jgi:hypothetical protein